MSASRSRPPGRTAAALFLALTGCDAVGKTLDRAQAADSIADSVTHLQQAVHNAANDPPQTDDALRSLQNDLKKIGDKTADADADKAVDDLGTAVGNVRTAPDHGDRTPDLTPATDAAGELTKVCTP
ncbi:hypothetical protein ABZ858_19450 [Streptomyces sp. NPDC047017]|uniref:hypothetical protein n=1 Tax=Streptomyces sp. NPDC047017 TaxID=3155024 RepID=UPI0033C2AE19